MDKFIGLLIDIDNNKLDRSDIIPFTLPSGKIKILNVIHLVPEEFKTSFERVWMKYIDLTDLVQTKQSLLEHEHKYKTIFDSVDDAIIIFDREKITDCNKATINLLGSKNKEFVLRKTLSDFSPEFQPDGKRSITKASDQINYTYLGFPQKFLWRIRRVDSRKEFDCEIKLNKINLDGKDILLGILRPYDFIYRDKL